MSKSSKLFVKIYFIACICYIAFGFYQVVFLGVSSTKELLIRTSPILLGSCAAWIVYNRFYRSKKN